MTSVAKIKMNQIKSGLSINIIAAHLCGISLVAVVLAINPFPLENYLVTISFAFPKYFALGLFSFVSSLLILRLNPEKFDIKTIDFVFALFVAHGILGALTYPTSLPFLLEWMNHALSMASLACLASLACASEKSRQILFRWINISAIIVASAAIYDAAGGPLAWRIPKRPSGFLGNRSDVAAFCAATLPIAIHFFLQNRKNSAPLKKSAMNLAIIALITLAMLLTRARAAWFATFALGILTCGLTFVQIIRGARPKKAMVLNTAVIIAVMAGAILAATGRNWPSLRWRDPSPYYTTLQRLTEYDRGTGLSRIQQNLVALETIAEHPVKGTGPGTWRREVVRHIAKVSGAPEDLAQHSMVPNSEYIKIATETGLLGLTLVFAVGCILLFPWGRNFLYRKNDANTGVAAGLIVIGVMSFFDSMTARPEMLALTGVFAGILRYNTKSAEFILPNWSRVWAAKLARLTLTAGICLTLIFGFSSYTMLTSPSPSSLNTLPAWIPLPSYSMLALQKIPVTGDDPCGQIKTVLRRSIAQFPDERGLQLAEQHYCPKKQPDGIFGQENATWSRSVFFRGYEPTKGQPLLEKDLEDFSVTLKNGGIKYAYIFSGPFQGDGSLPDYAFSDQARASILKIKSAYPEIQILPWIGGIQNRTVHFEKSSWMTNAVAATTKLIDTMPIDGIHLDFEYILPQAENQALNLSPSDLLRESSTYDAGILEFHRLIRTARPKTFISSVVVSTASQSKPWKKKHTPFQIEQISRQVNQLSFLYYDTQIDDAETYRAGLKEQLEQIKSLKGSLGIYAPQYLIAIGTFINEPELQKYRNLSLENVPYTINLLKDTIRLVSPRDRIVDGLAVYCEWQTSLEEWNQIRQLWSEKQTGNPQ